MDINKKNQIFPIIPSPFDGGGARVGVDKIKTFWVPPPLCPLPPRGGESFRKICLTNYGLLSIFGFVADRRKFVKESFRFPLSSFKFPGIFRPRSEGYKDGKK
jgi:hypothetical protein